MGTSDVVVRRVREDDWSRLRGLRLEALRDPVAHLAFLEDVDEALARPDGFWHERTRSASAGRSVCQVVAVDAGGEPVGTVTALVAEPGEPDYLGDVGPERRAAVVGVYVRPSHRGAGVLARLLAAVEEWLVDADVPRVRLHVHEQNERARRAYLRCGYTDVGGLVEVSGTPHHELVRELS
ncbi:GNAT family N-acetyltransferase [Aeromicrobium massiliense]|uniref:GNAT family N-acetyltransferase n=1 Tax=Aeromicrobium massiliense TaxID=1464554 RepID=UPI0002F59FEA|nr:GNAT family N-acetyltransferase [Aeromicrobium massiliense]